MIVCFTGHRALGTTDEHRRLQELLAAQVKQLTDVGATVFRTGGALGFDTEAAIAVLSQKKKTPQIRLELLLPCRDQCARWSQRDRELYEKILAHADAYTYLSEHYYHGVMQARNRALVNGADVCVAFLRTGEKGGTAYTVSYAEKSGVPVINLFKDL